MHAPYQSNLWEEDELMEGGAVRYHNRRSHCPFPERESGRSKREEGTSSRGAPICYACLSRVPLMKECNGAHALYIYREAHQDLGFKINRVKHDLQAR